MHEPSWNVFRSKNAHPEVIFEEDVALRLFCDEVDIEPSKITLPSGYAGIENIPVKVNGEWVAFQAKHNNKGDQNVLAFRKILKVIPRLKNGDYELDKIYCYSSGKSPSTNTGKTKEQLKFELELTKYGVAVEWLYSDQIIRKLEDTKNPRLIRASRRFFEKYNQPSLIPPTSTDNPEGFRRLTYHERLTTFIGRDNDISKLNEFIDYENIFSWWLVTAPALAGKSRLALEFCLSLPDNWAWGWINTSELQSFLFEDWKPDKDTFIVIDYALGKEKEIERFLSGLRISQNAGNFLFKVRVLFLERENSDWVRKIEHLETISNWVFESQFNAKPLQLEYISDLEANDSPDSVSSQLNNLFSILINQEANPDLREHDVRGFLEREKQKRWHGISDDAQKALVIATMCSGFDITKVTPATELTKNYIASLNCYNEVSKIVGADSVQHQYPPLEPDILGELMVLDYLKALNPVSEQYKEFFKIASELNPTSFVNFIYRCAQSYPNHKALELVINNWTDNPLSLHCYKATLANMIENPIFPDEICVEKYANLLNTLEATNQDLFLIDKILFLKILARFSSSNMHTTNVEIRVQPHQEIVITNSGENNTSYLDHLLPEDYCSTIISAWHKLPVAINSQLIGSHLIEVYHHDLLHKIKNKEIDIDIYRSTFLEVTEILKTAHPHLYSIAIYAFQTLCSNTVAALVQFNRREVGVMDFADEICLSANELCTLENEGRELIFISSFLDRIELGLTVLAKHSRSRDYQYILDRLKQIETRGAGINNDQGKITTYLQASVQATHGFTNNQIDAALEVLESARKYIKLMPLVETANAMTMMLGQFARETDRFDLGIHPLDLLEEATEFARQYPEEHHGIAQKLIQELSSRYDNYSKNGDIELAKRALNIGLNLLEYISKYTYEKNGGIYCGSFIDSGLIAYLEGRTTSTDEQEKAIKIISESPVAAWQQMLGNINPLGTYYSLALQALELGDTEKAERCMIILEIYRPFINEQGIDHFQEVLIEKIKDAKLD